MYIHDIHQLLNPVYQTSVCAGMYTCDHPHQIEETGNSLKKHFQQAAFSGNVFKSRYWKIVKMISRSSIKKSTWKT